MLCFNQADYDGMRQFARKELQHIDCELMSASMLWSHFSTVMQKAIKLFVPIRSTGNVTKKPLQMTVKVLRNVKKHKLWNKWKQHNVDDEYSKYKMQADKASKLVRQAKRDFERKIARNIKHDCKSFYAYTKSKSKIKPSVGPSIDESGTVVSEDKEMTELLNGFFHRYK